MQFNQSSPVQPNPEKIYFFFNLKKSVFQKNIKNNRNYFFAEKSAIFLILPIDQISLRPEGSSSAHFRIQGGPLSVTYIGAAAAATAGLVAGRYFSFLI